MRLRLQKLDLTLSDVVSDHARFSEELSTLSNHTMNNKMLIKELAAASIANSNSMVKLMNATDQLETGVTDLDLAVSKVTDVC